MPRRRVRSFVATILTAVCLCVPRSAAANNSANTSATATRCDATTAAWIGTFRHAGDTRERESLDSAIEAVVETFNLLLRPIVRNKLQDANAIPPTLTLRCDGDLLRAQIGDLPLLVAPVDGSQTIWRDQYGEDVAVRQHAKPGELVQRFRGERGGRQIRYTTTSDGRTLTFRVTITSERLPWPLSYQLTYRRASH